MFKTNNSEPGRTPDAGDLLSRIESSVARLAESPPVVRRLSDIRDCFVDPAAVDTHIAEADAVAYTVISVEGGDGDGDLHFGLGVLEPGRIGDEYFMTKGHLHAWRDASEIYIGMSGHGVLLLEHEDGGTVRWAELTSGSLVYVPARTAHRTINTGDVPLVYLGIYPAAAGHDYAAIGESNFAQVVVAGADGPEVRRRADHLATLH